VLLVNSWPANSRPAVSGGLGVLAYPPRMVIRSAKFRPPASTFTRTCSGVGCASGTCCKFENIGTAETSDDECFHAESLAVLRLREFSPAKSCFQKCGFGIYNDDRVSDPRGLRDFLASGRGLRRLTGAIRGCGWKRPAPPVLERKRSLGHSCLQFPFRISRIKERTGFEEVAVSIQHSAFSP